MKTGEENNRPIYTLDIETDPFEHGKFPKPFVVGFYDGERFVYRWGRKCIEEMYEHVIQQKPGIIYVHNGGKFDVFYLLDWLERGLHIINGRIVKANIPTWTKRPHEFRDSFAIMPFALAKYKKDEIDYTHLRKDLRDKYREEILSYLLGDCKYLHELCVSFVARFGDKLTIGSTAFGELQGFYKQIRTLRVADDVDIRAHYYYGGRVQCFKKGVIKQPINVYDVNSMYPFVMREFKHPIGLPYSETRKVTPHTFFVSAEGLNFGAFPCRTDNGIRFDIERGIFHVTIHEWRAALELGLFRPTKIYRCINFDESTSFKKFVEKFYQDRKAAIVAGDKTHALFYKFVLNSCYGKFAQNPENFKEYQITKYGVVLENYEPEYIVGNRYIIWKRPTRLKTRYNVATAASITGAARSILLRAIANAKKPLYCDTDSIICEKLSGVEMHDSNLGAWKREASGDSIAIAGKKLYAVFSEEQCIKRASKGVQITPEEITRVACGETVVYKRDAPSFRWNGQVNFITRKIQLT